jgi:hypothetical protein
MRMRAPALLLALLAACVIAPATATAADSPLPYAAEVTADQVADMGDQGFDLHELGFDPSGAASQKVEFIATRSEVAALAARGIEARAVPLEQPTPKSAARGDSPNPFFNVYRSYMEPGGIADEMRQIAADNPDVFKLERIGTSTMGKPILALKMTENARNVRDGSRHAILFSAVNHAREWIAAEMGRRLPGWFAEHKNDPKIRALIQTRELWFLPIQNPDGYDYTFTCGVGIGERADGTKGLAEPCDYRTKGTTSNQVVNRYWRKTMRDNDNDGVYGEPTSGGQGDGVDPNRNYPAKRGIDEEGASNQTGSETYRGPYALSEPENLAVDRLQRRVPFKANINYHSSGQLLLTPVSYTTDYYPPDSTLFDAITGTDGDEAVFPYRSQHSSDLYESNGDTIDNAYMNYGIIGWTPEMDTCDTMGDVGCPSGFASPDDEGKVQAVFNKNLAFALNVTESLPNLGRPRNFDADPSQYRVKPTQDIQVNRFDVSYGKSQVVEATIRKELGPADITASVGNQSTTIRMQPAESGERYNEVKGYYFERRRATIPAQIGNRALVAGDVVNVVVKAGGLQQEFRYRIAAVHDDTSKKRVLVVAAEDYTGKSPNVSAGYDTQARYLDEHVAALEAAGYEVDTFNIDAPPTNGGSPNPVVRPQIKYPTNLGVLSHFDAVNYYSGDDFAPQDVSETNPRRLTSTTGQTGSLEMSSWSHKVMLELRDYANEGGKLIVDGRNVHQAFTGTSTSLGDTGPYTWTPDKLFGFFYPEGNQGDDDLPATAWQRSREISNDTWQNYLGVVARQSGAGVTGTKFDAAPVTPKTGSLFDGMTPFTVDASSAGDPNQAADGSPLPLAKSPLRLRNWAASGSANEPLRQERIEADYTTTPAQNATGGAIISTRDSVTFGFGLEQVSPETRNELVKRSLAYLLPPTADTTAPTIAGFKWPPPPADFTATTRDPVEVDVTAFDERGDMSHVTLLADGEPVQTTTVFPFQFRYTPPASAAGRTVTLTAEAVDKAGNTSTRDLDLNVVAANAAVESPTPVSDPTITGSPVVGQQLSCVSGGFTNSPDTLEYEWLRNGATIAGATANTYTPTAQDAGRNVACREWATNSAGTGDATSESLLISAAPPVANALPTTPMAPAPVAPASVQKPTGTALSVTGTCKLASNRRSARCTIKTKGATNPRSMLTAVGRVSGTRKFTKSRSGRGSVKLTVRSAKRLKKGQRLTLKVRSGATVRILVVKAT